ncbi:hypothetical protein E2C01_022513 [Portunus trituberculatus]|uniref:Uncharacterized protein n=1 Tax=Portunus trituberculatus TaxID=210409 RepID=A0A5B7E669_PORTR|nr:hypothetical protein [Portunus trituberculatus]
MIYYILLPLKKELFCGIVPIITLFTCAKIFCYHRLTTNHCLNTEPWPHRTQTHFLRLIYGKKVYLNNSHQI